MTTTRRWRVGLLAVLLLAAIAGGLVLKRADQPEEAKFCNAALSIREIGGRTLAIQDTDPDGTVCEVGETTPGMETLGTDCKVRSPDGTVIDTLTSSRADDTCGQDSPAR